MTVIELRKVAKEMHVKLGAGVSKAEIISKLEEAARQQGEQQAMPLSGEASWTAAQADGPAGDEPEKEEAPAPEAPAVPGADAQPKFRAAWHNPSNNYSANRPAFQQNTFGPGQNRARNTGFGGTQRPVSYAPRFGPAASDSQESTAPADEPRSMQPAARRPPADGAMWNTMQEDQGDAPAYTARRPTYSTTPGYRPMQRTPAARPSYGEPQQDAERPSALPTAAELLAAAESEEIKGVLELHTDGYGFLHTQGFTASNRDVYVAAGPIRRYQLRSGDVVTGKVRPPREGDRFAALLIVSTVNGQPAEENARRPAFDTLTAVYPHRQINLHTDDPRLRQIRVLDLLTPVGFGQRALLLCQPDSGKGTLLRDLANVITANHPEAEVMVVMLDERPEDVTLFRDQVSCQVAASTFDQTPENHIRLADLTGEYAQRRAEAGKDVVLLVDSLTKLSKTFTTAAAQQGRAMPGMINPSSLHRAKRLFGSARALREGGSLTIFGCLDVETGNKVDDTIIEDFRDAATMTLVLDATLARAGCVPPIQTGQSTTRRPDLFLDASRLEGLRLMRSAFSGSTSQQIIRQLNSLVERTSSNDDLLARLPDWLKMMK